MAENSNPWVVSPSEVDDSKLLPVAPAVIPGSPAGAPPIPEAGGRGPYFAGTTAPQLGHDSTFVASMGTSPMIPRTMLMPLAPSANPSGNAAAQTIATQVVNKAIAALPPAAAASKGDGLVHGDAIWEIDSAAFQLRDDFMGNFVLAGGNPVGELGWENFTANTGGSGNYEKKNGVPPNLGLFSISNSSGANGFDAYTLMGGLGSSIITNNFWALLDYPSWKAVFVFGIARCDADGNGFALTKKSLYVGLAGGINLPSAMNTPRPRVFIGIRYDTDTTATAISDTTYMMEAVVNPIYSNTRVNTQGTTYNTGVAPVAGVFHRLEIQCIAAGVVTMSFDGGAAQTFTIPNYVAGTTTATQTQGRVGIQGALTYVYATTGGTLGAQAFANGSKVVVAGSGNTSNNGSRVVTMCEMSAFGGRVFWPSLAGEAANGSEYLSVTGLPALLPFFVFGNDSQVGPTNSTLEFDMDFFSFVWNPGIGGGTGTPDATKSRYF